MATFQLNDVTLDINPEQIQVSRHTINNYWNTLRTRSSIKTRSGYSHIDITLTCKFTDSTFDGQSKNGIQKLRDIVSQARVTPFMWVENEYLRAAITGSGIDAMVLALRNLEIHTVPGSINTLEVLFKFAWFNYHPYVKRFLFNQDIFNPTPVTNPAQSNAWKLFYQAEQSRGNYTPILQGQGIGSSNVIFDTDIYAMIPVQQIQKTQEELDNLQALQYALGPNNPNTIPKNASESPGSLTQQLINALLSTNAYNQDTATAAVGSIKNIIGTSMFNDFDLPVTPQNILDALNPAISERQHYLDDVNWYTVKQSEWQAVEALVSPEVQQVPAKQKDVLEFSTSLDQKLDDANTAQKANHFSGQQLMRQHSTLDFSKLGLIVNMLSVSFENVLAAMPVIGHPYPTYQHIGSIDGVVTLGITTTDTNAISALSTFYAMYEDQARKARMVPQGLKNIVVTNALINMCGLHDMILEDMTNATLPGNPGTSQVQMTLIDNPIDANTREQISAGQSFTSNQDLRMAVLDVLNKNLKLNTPSITVTALGPQLNGSGNQRSSTTIGGLPSAIPSIQLYSSIAPADKSQALFNSVLAQYATNLSDTMKKVMLAFNMNGSFKWNLGSIYQNFPTFFALTDDIVPGVSRMQTDLTTLLNDQKTNNPFFVMLNPGTQITQPLAQEFQGTTLQGQQIIQAWNALQTANTNAANASGLDGLRAAALSNLSSFRLNNVDLSNQLIEQIFGTPPPSKEWQGFITPFLDSILNNSTILSLPQFQTVRQLQTQQSYSGSDCYPDFPISNVIKIMQQKPTIYQAVLNYLNDESFEKKLGMFNTNISSLINPDFYVYNPLNLGALDKSPYLAMQSITKSIQNAQSTQFSAEQDWFEKEYQQLIGPHRYQDLKQNHGLTADQLQTRKVMIDAWNAEIQKLQKEGPSPELAVAGQPNPNGDKVARLQALVDAYSQIDNTRTGQNGGADFLEPGYIGGKLGPAIYMSGKNGNPITLSYPATDVNSDVDLPDTKTNSQSKHIVSMNLRPIATLSAQSSASSVIHDLGGNASQLDMKNEPQYSSAPAQADPNKQPIFQPPIQGMIPKFWKDGGWITSVWGWRTNPVTGAGQQWHPGIDIAHGTSFAGTPILASAPGRVQIASIDKTGTTFIYIQHDGGWWTGYHHMPPDDFHFIQYQNVLKNQDKYSKADVDAILNVAAGDTIAKVGNAGYSTGAHLHFEIRKGSPAEHGTPGSDIDPLSMLTGGTEVYKSQGPLTWIDPNSESLFTKSMEQLDKEMSTHQGYSLMRAYPTFKFYFIHTDEGKRQRFQFDSFFAYSAVQSITHIRNRKIPADLCILRLTNVSGVLSNRKFQEFPEPGKARTTDGSIVQQNPNNPNMTNTLDQNPIASLMLQPGVQVQLRLGYDNSADELETVFNGIITDVQFSGTDDMIEIICQSYGIQLTQEVYGEAKQYGGWFSTKGRTANLLEELMSAPEVTHFGRWKGGDATNPSTKIGILSKRWEPVPTPQDDNIFAPQGSSNPMFALDDVIDDHPYTMYQTTIWDVFQEMTLRHPGFIASAVPYKGLFDSARMTMFFGVPDQFYYTRDPTPTENQQIQDSIRSYVDKTIQDNLILDTLKDPNTDPTTVAPSTLAQISPTKPTSAQEQAKTDLMVKTQLLRYAQNTGLVKPFRSYHILNSTQHILQNNIQSSYSSTFNTVTLNYEDDLPVADVSTTQMKFKKEQSTTMSVEQGIPDEDKREMFARYYNCIGTELAKKYCIALLANSMKEGYRGSIIVIGNPSIKPYDICYIMDEYTGMYGPIEVEQVVHSFSQENGFITEITPNMVVHCNQSSTMSTGDAMGLIAENKLNAMGLESLASVVGHMIDQGPADDIQNQFPNRGFITGTLRKSAKVATAAVGIGLAAALLNPITAGVTIGVAATGMFCLRKLITRSQYQHPLRYTPLTIQGMPMIGGVPTRHIDGTFICGINVSPNAVSTWFKDVGKTAPLYIDYNIDRMTPNNIIRPHGSFL